MTTKLLAVDDSKTLRKVLEITFAGEDFQTELAASADEALQKLRANRPAVAVIDTALAGASGYDLCQQIKGEAPEVAVVLLSSKHRPYDQNRGAQVGADDYIDKPFDTQKLIDKVNGLLAGGAARPQPPAAHAPPPHAPPPQAPAPQAQPQHVQQPSAAPARPAPRPAVSAAPQRPVSQPQAPSAQPSRPASPSPAVSARPVAPAPSFGTGGGARPPAQPASPAAAPPRVAAAVAAAGADLSGQLQELGLDANQVQGVLALSREVLERVVWEVVPVLAETLIKEEIARLTAE